LQRAEFCRLVGKPTDPARALATAEDELGESLEELEGVLTAGDGPVRLDDDGDLMISPLIAEHYDDLLRLAGSLNFVHATASLLVGKLSASSRQNALAAALKEYAALTQAARGHNSARKQHVTRARTAPFAGYCGHPALHTWRKPDHGFPVQARFRWSLTHTRQPNTPAPST
jgi:Tn3 transposase DDE domain